MTLKNLILTTFFMCLLSSQLFSQFKIGIGAGAAYSSTISTSYDYNAEYRTGILFSVPITYDINEKVSLGLTSSYVGKGYKYEEIIDYKTIYLELIPEIRYQLINNLSIGVGVFYDFKLAEYIKFNNGGWDDYRKFDFNKDKDYGVSSSINYEIGNISFCFRYLHGIANISNTVFTDQAGEIVSTKVHTRSFQLSANYFFQLGS